MDKMPRRTFIKATAAGATFVATGRLGVGGASRPPIEAAGYFQHQFGISDELCRKILAKALSKGGDFAELYFEHTITNWLGLEDGKVNRASGDVSLGVGIRTVKGDQIGYGFTQEMTEQSMLSAAGIAATIADSNATKPAGEFVPAKLGSYYPLPKLLTDVSLDAKLPLVQGINDRCFSLSPLIVKVNALFHDQEKRILIVSSDGTKSEDVLPRTYLMAQVTAEKNGRREQSSWNYGGRRPFESYTPQIVNDTAKTVVDRVLVMLEARKAPAGEMPVVLGPGVTGVLLHEAIGHGMEADFNRKNVSTYSTMIGKQVADPAVTIVDDGTNPNFMGSINVDDEGTPSQRTVLVDHGVLTSYMHDKISAKHYKVAPTGNGRRQSYQHFIMPRMRNTYMMSGPARPEDVIRSVQKGIYVQVVGNGEVKIGEGDFAFYVVGGQLIENGKLTAPIKDVNIMGNGPKMLRNITMVANDSEMHRGGAGGCGKNGQGVPVGFGMPTVLVKSMTVGGSKA